MEFGRKSDEYVEPYTSVTLVHCLLGGNIVSVLRNLQCKLDWKHALTGHIFDLAFVRLLSSNGVDLRLKK